MEMKIAVKSDSAEKEPTEVIIISLFEGTKKVPPELNTLNKASGGAK
jgi:hypothetical protein